MTVATNDDLGTLFTVAEACRELKVSRTTIYVYFDNGLLEMVKVGGRTHVTGRSITALLKNPKRMVPRRRGSAQP